MLWRRLLLSISPLLLRDPRQLLGTHLLFLEAVVGLAGHTGPPEESCCPRTLFWTFCFFFAVANDFCALPFAIDPCVTTAALAVPVDNELWQIVFLWILRGRSRSFHLELGGNETRLLCPNAPSLGHTEFAYAELPVWNRILIDVGVGVTAGALHETGEVGLLEP